MFGHYRSLFLLVFFLKASTDYSVTETDNLITSAPVTESTEPLTTPTSLSTLSGGKEQSDRTCVPCTL